MTGGGLEPTTNGLTYLIGFRRPTGPNPDVESLDYPTAIAGVPRLVSEAGTGDPPPPCLLITQSPGFSTVTLAVAGDVVVPRALKGVPAYCGIHSPRFGFFPREAPILVVRRSPLLYRLSYPVKGSTVSVRSADRPV